VSSSLRSFSSRFLISRAVSGLATVSRFAGAFLGGVSPFCGAAIRQTAAARAVHETERRVAFIRLTATLNAFWTSIYCRSLYFRRSIVNRGNRCVRLRRNLRHYTGTEWP